MNLNQQYQNDRAPRKKRNDLTPKQMSTINKVAGGLVSRPHFPMGASGIGKDKLTNLVNKANDKIDQYNHIKKPNVPTYDTGSGTTYNNVYNPQKAIMDEYRRQNESARDNALASIEAQLKARLGDYDTQLQDIGNAYQAMINQSELNKYKSRKSVREALANRGQLDSGLGRQEALNVDTQYGNAVANIQAQEQRARNDIANEIARIKAEANVQKNNVVNSYNNAMANLYAQMM